MSTNDAIEFDDDALSEIRRAKLDRLQVLKAQAARSGYGTPAEIAMEIAELERDLGFANKIAQSPVSADVLAAAGPVGQVQGILAEINALRQFIKDGWAWRDEQTDEWRANESRSREAGQRRRFWIDVMVFVLIVVCLFLIAGLYGALYVQSHYIPR